MKTWIVGAHRAGAGLVDDQDDELRAFETGKGVQASIVQPIRGIRSGAITTTVVAIAVGLCACESDPTPPAASTNAAPAPTAAPAGSSSESNPSATATAAATAPALNPCEEHQLTLGGTGTRADMCKFEGDVLKANATGRIEDAGAIIRIENPWREAITWLSAAVYYYDASGKQLTIEVGDEAHRVARLDGVEVNIAGETTTEVPLGFSKEELPSEVDTVEVQILAFGWDAKDGKGAYFTSTTPFREFRAIRGGDGPTGISDCDEYRSMLESCPKQFPDALAAMRKSLRDYNNATPATQKHLVDQLTTTCQSAIESTKERCKPE